MSLLDVRGVTLRFGGLTALRTVSLDVREGEIRALIGPNGAGKTTFFNAVTGVHRVDDGDIEFDGHSIRRRKPHVITRRGIARTFQNIRLFGAMSALENVLVGADAHRTTGVAGAVLRLPKQRQEERAHRRQARELLEFCGIAAHAGGEASGLAYGDQRRLEIARALATKPRLLLLDEPAAGMNPAEKLALVGLIRQIRDRGVTVLLIDHDVRLVMGVSERICVLDHGEVIADGSPADVRAHPQVIEAYLGRKHA